MAGSALLNIIHKPHIPALPGTEPCVASQVSLVGKGGKEREVPKALWGC